MKYLLLYLLFISSIARAQKARITNINVSGGLSINYPVIITADPAISRKINNQLKEDILVSDDKDGTIKQQLRSMIKEDGFDDIDYTVTFNENGLLSLNIYMEESGAEHDHLVRKTYYYNFDLKTGEQLSMDSMTIDGMYEVFAARVLKDKIAKLNKYDKQEKDSLLKGKIDSGDYAYIIESDSLCREWEPEMLHDFILTGKHIEVVEPCGYEGVWAWLEPDYHLIYSGRTMKKYFKPEYFNRLFKYP